MSGGKYKKQSDRNKMNTLTIVLLLLLIVALGVIAFLLIDRQQSEGNVPDTQQTETTPVVKNTDTIDIPGYGAMNLTAGQTQQNVVLTNPPQNTCYFKISLLLADRTVLWESELISPGENSAAIVLNKPLERGSYENAILKYECFTLDENKAPLNGAETQLTLNVK